MDRPKSSQAGLNNEGGAAFLRFLIILFITAIGGGLLGGTWMGVYSEAWAVDTLPYTVRTQPYFGWNVAPRGDIRSVGMGGATTGLADNFISASENPAGLAMTVNGVDSNVSNNAIHDGYLQNQENPVRLSNFGFAASAYPWGFSVGRVTTHQEGQDYFLPSDENNRVYLGLVTSEVRLGLARVYEVGDYRFSLGGSLNLGLAEETLGSSISMSRNWGVTYSGMFQFPNRILVGLNLRPAVNFSAPSEVPEGFSNILPGFYQDVITPSRFSLGLGWIPNRFAKADLNFGMLIPTESSALIRDDQILSGTRYSIQPRLGISYVFLDLKNISSTFYGGTYLETSRISDKPGRVHLTGGIEARFWALTAGFAYDSAQDYQNRIFSVGVDLIRLLEASDLIPKIWHPPQGGWFPPPFYLSDLGLARPLVKEWNPKGPQLDPIQVGLQIPERAEKKFEEIKAILKEELGSKKSEPQKPKKKKSRKKRKA